MPSDREIFIFTPPFIVFDADYNTGCCCCTHHSSILFKRERARVCVYGERGPRPFGLRAVVIYFTVQKLVKVFLRPFKRASCEREKGFFTSIKQRAHTHTTHRQTTDSLSLETHNAHVPVDFQATNNI